MEDRRDVAPRLNSKERYNSHGERIFMQKPILLLTRRDVQEFVLNNLRKMHSDLALVEMIAATAKEVDKGHSELKQLERMAPELPRQVKVLADYIDELQESINEDRLVEARVKGMVN